MYREDYGEIKLAITQILKQYNVTSAHQWYTMDKDIGNELYETLKAEVVEVFNLDDDEMREVLEDVLE